VIFTALQISCSTLTLLVGSKERETDLQKPPLIIPQRLSFKHFNHCAKIQGKWQVNKQQNTPFGMFNFVH